MKERELYKQAIVRWGIEGQIKQAIEECAELITVLCHKDRDRADWVQVGREVADVEIMCSQLREIIGHEIVDEFKEQQLLRLKREIEKGLNRKRPGAA